jgi:uncharacterized protein
MSTQTDTGDRDKNSVTPSLDILILQAVDPARLELIILPTGKCNFRCVYCYETFNKGKMSKHICEGIKRFLAQKCRELKYLKLSWFGGEPLLAKDVIIDISAFAFNEARKYRSLEYYSDMTTNGYFLTSGVLTELISCGIRQFQITLDGEVEEHNKVRVLVNKFPTFLRLWKNLVSLKEVDSVFDIALRVHYSPDTLKSVSRLLERICKEFGSDNRYHVLLKQLSRLGSPYDNKIKIYPREEKIAVTQKLISTYGSAIRIIADTDESTQFCYASATNSFVIRSDGRIGKCTVALDHPANELGSISKRGEFRIDDSKLHLWTLGLETLDPGQLACPLNAGLNSQTKRKERLL